MTNGRPLGTAKDVVYRVTSSDPSMTLELNDGTVLKGAVRLENIEGAEFGEKGYLLAECCAWVKDIVPIPITPEILHGRKPRTGNRRLSGNGEKPLLNFSRIYRATYRRFRHFAMELPGAGIYFGKSRAIARRLLSVHLLYCVFQLRDAFSQIIGRSRFQPLFIGSFSPGGGYRSYSRLS